MGAQVLERTTFETSRLLEFFTEKELAMQIGHSRDMWPQALLKELIDNALDACESAGVAPSIQVEIEPDAFSVTDNGPGLPEATLERSLDYLVRVSDKAHYVSPTRGQLGNALKCVWAAPYVADGERGQVEIVTGGQRHQITVTLDRIGQRPDLRHTVTPAQNVKTGTTARIHWPQVASSLERRARDILQAYAAFNPHAAFELCTPGERLHIEPTVAEWRKWTPADPTSPHWYNAERLRTLIGAYIAEERRDDERRQTVREFVSEFHGLRGTAKQKEVTDAAGLSGEYLAGLIEGGEVSLAKVEALLAAMQASARPPRPAALGVLGKENLSRHLVDVRGIAPESIKYHKAQGEADGLPYVLEAAFGVCREDAESPRQLLIGLNWSAALESPAYWLNTLLGEQRVDGLDQVAVIVHIASPVMRFTDRGKGALALPGEQREALEKAIKAITKDWKAAKRRADREDRVRRSDLERFRVHYHEVTIKEAAYQVMREAYRRASANGTLPANARQIMYAARPMVLEVTGGKIWSSSAYFTQRLLPDFIENWPDDTKDWSVVYDARGHITEPHTGNRTDLGTQEVYDYIETWGRDGQTAGVVDLEAVMPDRHYPTYGPANRYSYALFIEKEGFNPLLQQARIADRYDIAIMSTKGMSVTAARSLVERLSEQGVTILVARDFDQAGFSIVHTLRTNSRRYRYKRRPNVVDIGLRLSDVEEMGLEGEPVEYRGQRNPQYTLKRRGATEAEADFLVSGSNYRRWTGQRVELNAMMADQFVAWLERKLKAAGVQKVIPDAETLEQAYKRAAVLLAVREAVRETLEQAQGADIAIPGNLDDKVRRAIAGSGQSWDDAVWTLAVNGGRSMADAWHSVT